MVQPAQTPIADAAAAGQGSDIAAQLRAIADHLMAWLGAHSADIAIATAAGALLYLVLRSLRRIVRNAATRHRDQDTFGAITLRVLATTRHFFLIMVATRLVIGYANAPPLVGQTVRFLFVVSAAVQAAVWARAVVMSIVRARADVGASDILGNALSLINVLVSVAFFAIAGIVVLDNVGVNVTGLVAGLGIGGIAIGLAAKGVFEDLFAALAIIFDRPFRKGDTIRFADTTASVERIGLKSTRLRSLTGEEVVISNTNLLNETLSNLSQLDHRRISLNLALTYETPVDALRRVPDWVAQDVAGAGHRLVRCGFVGFGASSLDFIVQFDVMSADYDVAFAARHQIGLALVERLSAQGIAFAYPTQTTYTAAPDGTLIMPFASPSSLRSMAGEAPG